MIAGFDVFAGGACVAGLDDFANVACFAGLLAGRFAGVARFDVAAGFDALAGLRAGFADFARAIGRFAGCLARDVVERFAVGLAAFVARATRKLYADAMEPTYGTHTHAGFTVRSPLHDLITPQRSKFRRHALALILLCRLAP